MTLIRCLLFSILFLPTAAFGGEIVVACLEGSVREPIAASYGAHTEDCAVDETTDADQFEFVAQKGDKVWLLADGQSRDLDPQIKLYAGTTEVALGRCGADQYRTCTAFIEYEVAQSGLHTAVVSDWGGDNPGNYVFQIERLVPNETASVISYDDAVASAVAPTTDVDFYRFPVARGTRIQVLLDGFSRDLDPEIRVIDGAGVELDLQHCGADQYRTCTTSAEFEIAADDTYTVLVRDWGGDNPGDYGLSVNCLVGRCPDREVSAGLVEIPGERISGFNVVSGWKCPQNGEITVQFDGQAPLSVVGRLSRLDTAVRCSNAGDNGFLIPFNYARLGAGKHTAVLRDGGVEFDRVEFTVETLGAGLEPFARGLQKSVSVPNFPRSGDTTVLEWRQELQGFVLKDVR